MSSALQAFMNQLVDYAGLFPPAGLDMASAVKEFAGHRGESESWMLGRFIVPAGRLAEMAAEAEGYLSGGGCWGVSALLGDRESSEKSLAMLETQCLAITDFEKNLNGQAAVEVLEVPVPSQVSLKDLPGFLNQYLDGLDGFGVRGRDVFLEIPPGAPLEFERPLLEVVEAVAASRSGAGETVLRLGAKLRCGGVTPEAFPTVERISRTVAHCRDLGLALKCTAGLHHPVRHQATNPPVMMHGFLNVFGAGLLAHALGWDAEKLVPVLVDTEPNSFIFEAGSFSWRGHAVAIDTVRQLRTQFLCGFGSCSFDEPREDLQNLGLL